MRFVKIFTVITLISGLFSFTATKTNMQGWNFIGDKIVAYGPDRDVLFVTGNDVYRQIKIKVTGAPLHIVDMDVYFENGEKQHVELKNRFRQGQESRVIDFAGGDRRIKKIEFLYSTVGRAKGKARVAVWGKR